MTDRLDKGMFGDITESQSESVARRGHPVSPSGPHEEDQPSLWKNPADLLGP